MTKPAHKLAHINKAEIELAARKGLMMADSHYFAWPAKQQERFRATMSEKARQKVECVLIDCLFATSNATNTSKISHERRVRF